MAERRTLTEGLKTRPDPDRTVEERFVFGEKPKSSVDAVSTSLASTTAVLPNFPAQEPRPLGRVPLTTRVRADLADAIKRASLERQLQRIEPHTVQEILEQVLEPWLKAHGYLS